MRLILMCETHINLINPPAISTDKMVMMLMSWVATDKKHGLPVISVHPVEQPALQEAVDCPIDGRETDIAPQHSVQFILDLLGRIGPFADMKAVQQGAHDRGHASAAVAKDLPVLVGYFGRACGHAFSFNNAAKDVRLYNI